MSIKDVNVLEENTQARLMERKKKKQLGQGMTEYIVITALVAVAGIAAYSLFGQTIQKQVASMALEVSGKSSTTAISEAQGIADKAVLKADEQTDLGNFDEKSTGYTGGTGGQ